MSEDARIHEPRWFPSQTEPGVAALLSLPPLGALVTLVGGVKEGRFGIALVPVALVLAVYLGLLFPAECGIDEQTLYVRSGLFRLRLPLAAIRSVHALQKDKRKGVARGGFEVRWGEGPFERTRVHPRERLGFLELLAERTGLERSADGLAPRSPTTLDGA
jgi:hypothetical protein